MDVHLVTGGAGFVGCQIVRGLLQRGHRVRVLDLLPQASLNEEVEYIQGSILDRQILERAISGVDAVHHIAAAVPLVGSNQIFQAVNIQGTQEIAEVSLRHKVRHFNYMSSSAIYGLVDPQSCPIYETQIANPFEPYGKSKLKGEKIVQEVFVSTDTTYSILRPRTVIGPGRLGIFELLFNWIYFNKKIFLIGNGKNKLQLIHVDDLANACILASEKQVTGIFNLGTDRFETLAELIQQVCLRAGSSSQLQPIPVTLAQLSLAILEGLKLVPFGAWHYRTFHRDYYFDISSAQKRLGWQPEFSNLEMMEEAYNWYTKNRIQRATTASVHNSPMKSTFLNLFMRK